MNQNNHRPNRYQPTRENFILRMKKVLYDLARQANTTGDKPEKLDSPPPERQQRATDRL